MEVTKKLKIKKNKKRKTKDKKNGKQMYMIWKRNKILKLGDGDNDICNLKKILM